MKKLLLVLLAVLLATPALAVVSVKSNDVYIGEAVTIDVGGSLGASFDGSEVDLSIYQSATDPCGVIGAGTMFYDTVQGKLCFCNSLEVDLSLYDGTTACF